MTPGERVELPAHFDAWMQGDRYGEVVKVTTTHTHVAMDRSRRTLRVSNEDMELYGHSM